MKILFLVLLNFLGAISIAQDSWKVCLDKKILLNTSTEDAEKNIIKLSLTNFKKAKTFTVTYTETAPQKGWERSISLYNDKDAELKKQTTKNFSLQAAEIKSLIEKWKMIKIYTINMPTDPKLKAQVRIRRILLCTLILE